MKSRKTVLFALLLTSFFPHVSSATGYSPGARAYNQKKALASLASTVLSNGKNIVESVAANKERFPGTPFRMDGGPVPAQYDYSKIGSFHHIPNPAEIAVNNNVGYQQLLTDKLTTDVVSTASTSLFGGMYNWLFNTPPTSQIRIDESYTGHRRMTESEIIQEKIEESIYNQVKQQLDQSSQSRNQYECCPPPVCCPTEKNQDEKKDKKKRESSSRALDEWVQLAHLLASVCPIVTQFAWLTISGWTRLICDVVPATGSLVYKTASYAGSCLYNLIPGRSSVDDGTGKQSLIKNSNLWTEETIDFSKKSRNQDMVIE